ncbi:unannotated protein [freshwater metagenome]|uniref:Unannotated protein n=1 Tax=freshwater metagenome TaxID=449393 RepID=A0A6J6D1X5_9ZZZZ
MQDAGSRSHPLGISVGDGATTAIGIHVIEDAIDDVRDGFKAAVWMPWCALWLTGCIFNFAHLIEMNEGIKLGEIDAGKCTADREAFPFETLWRSRYLFNGTWPVFLCVQVCINAREDGDVGNCHCWHLGASCSVLGGCCLVVVACLLIVVTRCVRVVLGGWTFLLY